MEGLGILPIVGAMQVPSIVKSLMQQKHANDIDMQLKQHEMEQQAKFMDDMAKEISTW